ncbi:Retrovirus-related Pol polyprotein from transposon 17.6 [Stylophora pistillata]|uniref:Retrovirus-related Pol polyprotein from transposon 17.6 n=1 Tax=Stylophora pistillata TaxID=50429 RepID=A0A2B4RXD0_STYPI|nr:Retrovirus-related Pol polyprotein from transposon 17.6 [Stylophora pistillata]
MTAIGKIESFDETQEKWETYVERMEQFFSANNIDEDHQVPTLLSLIGSKTYTLLRDLLTPDKPATKSFREIVTTLRQHLSPKPLEIVERLRFYKRIQREGETVLTYVADLKKLATHCNFGANLNETLRDKLVCGFRNVQIQKRLLSEAKLKYSKALEIAAAMETAIRDASELQSELQSEPRVDKISDNHIEAPSPNPTTKVCYRCGGDSHATHNCRFKDQTCYHCGKVGHISRACRSKQQGKPKQPPKPPLNTQVHSIEYSESDEFEDVLGSIQIHNVSKPSSTVIWIDLKVEGKPLKMELDTGSAVSIIPHNLYREKFHDKPLQETKLMLKTYTGENIFPAGVLKVNVEYKDQQPLLLDLYVVKNKGPVLMGRDWLHKYNRLVFGITSAPAIWQRTIDQVLEGTSGTSCILDDMIITGKSDEEHLANLEEVLRRLQFHGLRANKAKCIGAVLSHVINDGTERPIAFASKTITKTEQKYAQIDKEALSIIWGVKKFHMYMFGRPFTICTYHQPLTSIFHPRKSIRVVTATHLQRYALFLAGYDYSIQYKNTKFHSNADGLSRLPLVTEAKDEEVVDPVGAFNLMQFDPLPVTVENVRRETQRDPVLAQMHEMTSMFLVVVDAHSRWLEIEKMNTKTSAKTTETPQKLSARYSVPAQLVSDNGPKFASEEFQQFLKRNGIKHITSAPYHPATNGLAERAVQSFKNANAMKIETEVNNRQMDQSVAKSGCVTRHFSIGQRVIARNYTGKSKGVPATTTDHPVAEPPEQTKVVSRETDCQSPKCNPVAESSASSSPSQIEHVPVKRYPSRVRQPPVRMDL